MLQKPSACLHCVLYNEGKGFSRPEGTCKNGVLIIGESLGSNEVMDALPFRPHAEAGSALHTAFRLLGMDRKNFALWNMIGCQPPFNNLENAHYEYDAINHCKVHFDAIVKRFNPKVILALGNVPLKHLWKRPQEIEDYINSLKEDTKEEKAIKKKYLRNFKIGNMRGYIVESVYGIPLISSFHPSYITQDKGRTQLGTLMRDIKIAVQLSQHGLPKFQVAYDEDPTPEKIKDFYEYCKANPNLVISHDIETPMTTLEIDESETEFENQDVRDIDSIQFSVKEGTGIFIPWYGDFNLEYIAKILALPNPKVGWNSWAFDEVNIEYHLGIDSIAGENHDAMWMFKWLNQDFVKAGRALQFATNFASPEFKLWKYLAQLYPKKYGCFDVDAALRNFNWLKKSFQNPSFRFKSPLTKKLVEDTTKSVWQGYLDDIVYLRPILKDISKRGFPVDVEQREIFKQKILLERNRVLATLQDMYPMQLRNVSPKEGYKRIPNEVFELTEKFNKQFDFFNDEKYIVTDGNMDLLRSKYIETHSHLEGKDWSGLVVKEFNFEGHVEKRYCRIQDFKPKSREQVIAYIKFKKYKVPTVRDRIKGERESTSKDLLQPLWEETGDDLLYKTIYLRELDHMLDTYVGTDTKEGWKLGSDSRVHTTFTFLPSTGQLSSIRPNIQNCFSSDTEVLTENGWIYFNDLQKGVKVAQFDTRTEQIEFVIPDGYTKEFTNNPLIRIFSDKYLELLVTPEHDCLFKHRRKGTYFKVPAKDYTKCHLQLQAGIYIEGKINLRSSQIALITAFIADGSLHKQQGKLYAYAFNFKKIRKINRLRQNLQAENIKYSEQTYGTGYTQFYIPLKEIPSWWYNKQQYGNWLLTLDQTCLQQFRLEVQLWDGYREGNNRQFYTTNKNSANWVQIIGVLTNTRTILTPKNVITPYSNGQKVRSYVIGFSSKNHLRPELASMKSVAYNNYVYCVTMPKGTVIIRRLGKVAITGNSPARGTKYSSEGYEELAKQFRRTIAARSGYKLLSADWSAFHINTLAFEAEDADYMRVGRIDPHSFLAAEITLGNLEGGALNKLKQKRPNGWDDVKWKERILVNEEATIRLKDFTSWLKWDDDKLAEMLSWFKKNFKMTRNSQAKPAILGMGFGMGVNKFYKMNRHTFPNKTLPEKILGLMRQRFPKTFVDYHEKIKELADQQTYLISRYGYVRRFYNVYDWRLLKNPRPPRINELVIRTGANYWVRKEGGSANEAIAYLPSNNAFGFKKECMRALWNHPNGNLVKKFGLINEIHDDLFFEVEEGLINEAIPIIKEIMEAPASYLKNSVAPKGLITRIEMKIGKNWADMETI